MPTYEYECLKCGHHFEKFQSMTDEPVKRCPECRCKVKRLLGIGAGIIFKGSGFYQTDYRSESYSEGARKEKAASETKTDKKDSAAKKDSGKKKAKKSET